MTNRNGLIEQVQNWKNEWNKLVESARESGDVKAAEKLKASKPDFESLIHSLNEKSGAVQQELWQEKSGSSDMQEIVKTLKQKVAKLSLPKV